MKYVLLFFNIENVTYFGQKNPQGVPSPAPGHVAEIDTEP